MDNKVQELAEKIYQEGVQKASKEAEDIIQQAKDERDRILSQAQSEADELKSKSVKENTELSKNTRSEVNLATFQAIEALRTEITQMITDQVVTSSINEAFGDPTFLYNVIAKMAEAWAEHEEVKISTPEAEQLEKYFESKAQEILNKGVTIEKVNGKEHTFELGPSDGSYKVNISKEAFVEYFKDFLSPRMRDFLFKQDHPADSQSDDRR